MDKINELRSKIDDIDTKIMTLLDKRFLLTNEIGKIKKESKSVVLDSKREEIIFNKTSLFSHSPELKTIYKTIMDQSKKLQRR